LKEVLFQKINYQAYFRNQHLRHLKLLGWRKLLHAALPPYRQQFHMLTKELTAIFVTIIKNTKNNQGKK